MVHQVIVTVKSADGEKKRGLRIHNTYNDYADIWAQKHWVAKFSVSRLTLNLKNRQPYIT